MIVQGAGTIQQIFQVLQQEWKAIGVNLTLLPSQNPVVDFYVRHASPLTLLSSNAGAGTYGILNPFTPGLIGDVCNYNDPTITGLATTVKGIDPASSQGVSLLKQIQKLIYQQALEVFIANTPVVVAYDPNVRNLVVNPYIYAGLPIIDYWSGVGISK
jgi:ABC-type transport system substrate-binding protein